MNITQEKADDLNMSITVKLEPEDYEGEVEKVLRDYRKKVVLDGFRPGKVPFGLVKKMYGKSALVDEVNKKFSEAISGYIVENKLDILGEPLPAENEAPIDWENQQDFSLTVDVALAPEFEAVLSTKIKIPYYTIRIDDKILKEYVDAYRRQFGEMKDADTVDDKDYLKGNLTEANPDGTLLPDGLKVEDASISLMAIRDEKIQSLFKGKKKGDTVTLEMSKAFPDETDLAALLHVEKVALTDLKPHFVFEITEIQRFVDAEENQDFYDKLFGKDEVKSHAEFIEKIKETIRKNLDNESENRFRKDAVNKLLEVINPPLPEAFLKRWLLKSDDGKLTPEQIESEFDTFIRNLKWEMIRDKIADAQEIEASAEEILEYAKSYTHAQFHQYGLGHLSEEEIEKFAREQMEKEENYRRFAGAVLDRKVIDHVKTAVKIDDKKVSRDAFNKLYEDEEKQEK
ncbi:MAG: trigger factor [Chlorobi bacterium]|nr:trigger factor [Chlorobiota bacterium]